LAHGLRSSNISVLDAKTFYIPNLHYDGAGPDAYFWVGNGSKPNIMGIKVNIEKNVYRFFCSDVYFYIGSKWIRLIWCIKRISRRRYWNSTSRESNSLWYWLVICLVRWISTQLRACFHSKRSWCSTSFRAN
jgi:hypothetical protein